MGSSLSIMLLRSASRRPSGRGIHVPKEDVKGPNTSQQIWNLVYLGICHNRPGLFHEPLSALRAREYEFSLVYRTLLL